MTAAEPAPAQRAYYLAPAPFSPKVLVRHVVVGATIAQMLVGAVQAGDLAVADVANVVVHIDGERLAGETVEERRAVLGLVPDAGQIVNVTVEPMGGQKGRKIMTFLVNVAAIVVTYFFGPVWGAVAALAGNTILALAYAPKKPDTLPSGYDRGALQGQSNIMRPGEPYPLIMGKQRIAFEAAVQPYTQMVGDDVWLHMIWAVHYGRCQVEDIKIGETLLSTYPSSDVQVAYHLTPGARTFSLYPARVDQENLADQLDLGGDFEVHTTTTGCRTVEIDFTWPGGLSFNKDNGSILPQEVQILVEYKAVASGTWLKAPIGTYKDRNGNTLAPGNFYIQARSQDPVRRTVKFTPPSAGQFDVRCKAWDPDGDDQAKSVNATYWTALRSIEPGKPVVDETLALIEMRIRSSEDMGGSLPTVSGVTTPMVPIWNGTNWNTVAATSNQAALARWAVTGAPAAKPLTAAQIDASCADAYELIEENNWHAAFALKGEATQEELLVACGQAARFSTYWNGSKLCFVTDWEKPAPRQVFTQRNIRGWRGRREFPKVIHGLRVTFGNREEDDQKDELYVYADGYSADGAGPTDPAEIIETLDLPYNCTPDRAFREGRVYLARRELQTESFEWTAGADAVVTTYGDRVLVRHGGSLYGLGESRVQNRLWSGGLVSGIRLEDAVAMETGKTYAIDVRRKDTVLRGLAVVTQEGARRVLTFGTPLAEANAPRPGDLLAFGETSVVTEDVEIVDVEPSADGTVTLRAVRYRADDLMAAETGPVPPFQTQLQARPVPPTPRFLGPAIGRPEGVAAAFDIDPTRAALVAGFQARWRRTPVDEDDDSGWLSLPLIGATARVVRTPPIPTWALGVEDGEYKVDLEVRTVMRQGDPSPPARMLGISVISGVLASESPGEEAWSVEGATFSDNGVGIPALVITGLINNPTAERIMFEYRVHGEPNWAAAGLESVDTIRKEITAVTPGTAYDVAISYVFAGVQGARLVLGPVNAGSLIIPIPGNAVPDGTVLFTQNVPGSWTFAIPEGVTHVDIEIWGGGGGGAHTYVPGDAITPRGGGGGGGYSKKAAYAVAELDEFGGTVGAGGQGGAGGAAYPGTATTCATLSMNANGGGAGTTSAGGGGGTASGGNVNTSGSAGTVSTGGGAGNGGGPQTTLVMPGTAPGGGASGGGWRLFGDPPVGAAGAPGRVQITARVP